MELPLGPSAHALRSPRGSPPPHRQEAKVRLSKVFPGLRNEGQGPPLRREPPKRTYTGLRASSDPPHSGTLTAATTSARAANPLLRSPNGCSTPVKPHAPERAPPSSASLCLPPANRKSRRVAAPPLFCLQLTNGDSGRPHVPPPLLGPGLWAGESLRRKRWTDASLCA